MAATTFTDQQTIIYAAWLNQVDTIVFGVQHPLFGGADPTGVTSSSAALQAALNTGKNVYIPRGTYRLTARIDLVTRGQIIFGDGRDASIFLIDNVNYAANPFPLGALGVFYGTAFEEGPQFKDVWIRFIQPATGGTRASLIAYPPAIYLNAVPRLTVTDCKISNAMTGIDFVGNCGGAMIDLLEMSAYNYGIKIDGCLDVMRVNNFHFWPFDMDLVTSPVPSTTNFGVFMDATTVGISTGRCDVLSITNGLFIGAYGTAINSYESASGSSLVFIATTDFDSYGGLVISAGQMGVSNCLFTQGGYSVTTTKAIAQTGGNLRVIGCEFDSAVALTTAQIHISGSWAAQGCNTTIVGCIFRPTGVMTSIFGSSTGFPQNINITGNSFLCPADVAQAAKPVIHSQTGAGVARMTVVGNRISDKGTNNGIFVTFENDTSHVCTGNVFNGWTLSNIKPQVFAVINNNTDVDAWIAFTPTVTATVGTFTTVSATGLYKQISKTVHIQMAITITTNGTAATQVNATLPVTVETGASTDFVLTGRAKTANIALQVYCQDAGTTLGIVRYDGTYPGASGEVLIITGTIQST